MTKLLATKYGTLSRFDMTLKLFETRDIQLIKDHWHDDYMHLSDTQLDTRDNFEEFLKGLWDRGWSLLDPKSKPQVIHEDEDVLVVRHWWTDPDGTKWRMTNCSFWRDNKCWREMVNEVKID